MNLKLAHGSPFPCSLNSQPTAQLDKTEPLNILSIGMLDLEWNTSMTRLPRYIVNKMCGNPYGSDTVLLNITTESTDDTLPGLSLSHAMFLFSRLFRVLGNLNQVSKPDVHYQAICALPEIVTVINNTEYTLDSKEKWQPITKAPPPVDPNRILDIAGARLAEFCITDKPGFEGGRAEAIKCYFMLFSSFFSLHLSLIAGIPRMNPFPNDVPGTRALSSLIFPFLQFVLSEPHPNAAIRRDALTILNTLYPFGNHFGDLAIPHLVYTDNPNTFFVNTIPSVFNPSFPDAVYTDVPVPLQRQVEHEDNKRFHIPIPEFFLDWDSCTNNPSKAEEQPDAVKEFKALYTFEARPHTFRELSSVIFLLLKTLLKNGEEPDFSCFSRLMWTLTTVIHHETSNAQELDARPSDPFAQHNPVCEEQYNSMDRATQNIQAIFNYFQSLFIMTIVGGDNRSSDGSNEPEILDSERHIVCLDSIHTVGCLLNFLSTRHRTICIDCISSLIATTQSIVISTQRQISFGSSKADEEAVSYSLLVLTDLCCYCAETLLDPAHSSLHESLNVLIQLCLQSQSHSPHTLPDSPQVHSTLHLGYTLLRKNGIYPLPHDTTSSSQAHPDFHTQKSVTEWTAQAEKVRKQTERSLSQNLNSDETSSPLPFYAVFSFFLQNNESLMMMLESPPDPSSEDVEAAQVPFTRLFVSAPLADSAWECHVLEEDRQSKELFNSEDDDLLSIMLRKHLGEDQTTFSLPTEVVIDDQLPLFRTSWSDTPTAIPRDAVYASSTQQAEDI
ncbi:hypothetical protein BLNAU_2327 [Blattamonas nauphoetae]|uniref:Uncharacterized protein n=1 Tax=Blattamonas nauphoetae TaxID=2049346 RepID=A0ABQ9YFQ4_9EUKA|nr:hypothetical protein BLNAU_2327 [Blattamonas nauphoetae]